jgi:hypothetical protein
MINQYLLDMEDFNEKINIDDLYEHKKKQDLNQLKLFNKILNTIHKQIKTVSRNNEMSLWYIVPEMILGAPKYQQADCIAYLFDKLKTNGFMVQYYNPNTFFICWAYHVPSYVRQELQKKTGIVVDELGNRIIENGNESKSKNEEQQYNPNEFLIEEVKQTTNKKTYTPINSYKPTGNFIYDPQMLEKIENDMLNKS